MLCSEGSQIACLWHSHMGVGGSFSIMNILVPEAGQSVGDSYSALKFSVCLFGVDQRPLSFIFFPEFL